MNLRTHLPTLLGLLFAILTPALAAEDAALTGVTEPMEQIDLAFPEPGVIRTVDVKEGDLVKKDQVLAQLDCRVLESQLKIARMKADSTAAIQSASATLTMRQQRHEQLQRLAASDNANADELARAKAEFEIAQADLQLAHEAAAEHALEASQIEAQIEQRTLRAPFDGVVARIARDPAASVTPNDGPIVSLVQLDRLDLVVHVDHRRLDSLAQGRDLAVESLDRRVQATARVEFISPVIDPSSGTARVRLSLPNEQRQHLSGVKYRVLLPPGAVAGTEP